MSSVLFATLKKTAELFGQGDPDWLKEEKEQEFITVEEGTTGPQVVLLHGLLGALSNWDSVLPVFAEFCRPIALQFPLLTGTHSEVKVHSLSLFTEYFVKSRNLAPVTLCGNSLGGHVALRLCLARPELVDCLILSGTSGLYEHSVDALPVRPDRPYIKEQMARVFYQEKFINESSVEEIYEILSKKSNVLNLVHAARSAKKDNLLHYLKQIKVPTLLLWGEDDVVTSMDVAEIFHKEIPNSKLVTVSKCGHAPMIEYPEWFAEETRKFLREHSRFYR